MEKRQTNQNSDLRNPILLRWQGICADRGEAAAIFAPDGTVSRTFSQINTEANFWAEMLVALPEASVISIQTGNHPGMPETLLASWQAGHGVLLCDQELGGSQRDKMEALCGVQGRFEIRDGLVAFVHLANPPVSWPGPLPDLLKLTSGTTSEPRAIRFSAAQLLADCDNVCETMGITVDDINYGVISFTHSYGFSNLVTPLLCRGVSLVAAKDVLPRAVMDGLKATRASVLPGVPALFRHLAEFQPDFAPPRLCISAGAPLTTIVAERFSRQWGRKIHVFYGSSETGGISYDRSDESQPEGFVGSALANVEINQEEADSRVTVISAAVGTGYWLPQPEDSLRDGKFQPADLLRRVGPGYTIVGRVSDMINVAGRKVNPAEIERVIRDCPGVQDVAVCGLPSSLRGEDVAACVAGETSEALLREFCARSLPGWQVPKKWVFCEKLPTSFRGKISRQDLRALFKE